MKKDSTTDSSPFPEEKTIENNGASSKNWDIAVSPGNNSPEKSQNRVFWQNLLPFSWQFNGRHQQTAIAIAYVLMLVGFAVTSQLGIWLALLGSVTTLLLSLTVVAPTIYQLWQNVIPPNCDRFWWLLPGCWLRF